MSATTLNVLRTPPDYCKYADGPCDQDFSTLKSKGAFFAFPGNPPQIASTIVAAAKALELASPGTHVTWRELPIQGQTIFCEICKAFRESTTIFADITTLNLNLMFEIGYGIGLGLPVVPIRDTNYSPDQAAFDEIGLFDTTGYLSFSNHEELAKKAAAALPGKPLPAPLGRAKGPESLYLIKFKIQTDADLELHKLIKKSKFSYTSYDPTESSRLSLSELRRSIHSSFGVIGHLYSKHRQGALAHNALTALACGMAAAEKKFVLMLQEERESQPIDYRDIVKHYASAPQIKALFEPIFAWYIAHTQKESDQPAQGALPLLERLDLGDIAAENEIRGLKSYFVRTGQFNQAKQGHARLVVGRKGSGKTAIYYGVLQSLPFSPSNTVLDLKPEGHQFTRMKETVLARMTAGLQEHTMTAFWNYVLLTELARKIVYRENHLAYSDPDRLKVFERIKDLYKQHDTGQDEDFPQRLSQHILRLSNALAKTDDNALSGAITHQLYSQDIRHLNEAVSEWLKVKEYVWILVDNIDKGWPTRGSTAHDIVIVKALLEATRKLQKQLMHNDVEVSSLLFIRADIYDHLQLATADKGKDTAIFLEWHDPESFKELLRQRISTSIGGAATFEQGWNQVFDPHVDGEYAFDFVLERTLQRPRELLLFLRRSIEIALNRNHVRVSSDDFKQAAIEYSDDLLLSTAYEIEASRPAFSDLLYHFETSSPELTREELIQLLGDRGIPAADHDEAIALLLEFGFLGVQMPGAEPTYSYRVQHNLARILANAKQPGAKFVIHLGYRASLKIGTSAT